MIFCHVARSNTQEGHSPLLQREGSGPDKLFQLTRRSRCHCRSGLQNPGWNGLWPHALSIPRPITWGKVPGESNLGYLGMGPKLCLPNPIDNNNLNLNQRTPPPILRWRFEKRNEGNNFDVFKDVPLSLPTVLSSGTRNFYFPQKFPHFLLLVGAPKNS